MGLWERIPADTIHILRDAQVLDGDAQPGMRLDHADGNRPQLGFLIANHLIRRAAFAAIAHQDGLRLMCGRRVIGVEPGRERSRVCLSDGQTLTTQLVVAADSRFSETRRAMGIPADSHDFGRTMMVCRMNHERPYHHVALEWSALR